MSFLLTEDHLLSMFRLANFDMPESEMIFFALRGVSPVDTTDATVSKAHLLIEKGVDFDHMRCTIGQWRPGEGFAVFPGSTVPHVNAVRRHIADNGDGVNMLAPCYLTDLPGSSDHRYRKGDHGIQSRLGPHRAFRNEQKLPIWRTGDDAVYEGDDRLEYFRAFDNLHCARKLDPTSPGFSSFGCQVVAGAAGGPLSAPGGEKGPWRAFVNSAYAISQKRFRYALFNEGEALRTAMLGATARTPSIRFGSTGELARYVQTGLLDAGYDIGASGPDGVIGFQTLSAVHDIQLKTFGPQNVDLVVGPMTAEAIGIDWPVATDDGGVAAFGDERGHIDLIASVDGVAPVKPRSRRAFQVDATREEAPRGGYRWVFMDTDAGVRRYLGGEASLQGFRGLARLRGFNDENAPIYDFSDWVEAYGPWAALIEPTGEGESHNSFSCLNSYDRAGFTFGFFQLAAHTPKDNLILLFRELLQLPRASFYFPDLTLNDGEVFKRVEDDLRPLEGARDRTDGYNRPGEQGAFMEYLNDDMKNVDAAERCAAAALIHWSVHDEAHRRAQVDVAVRLAKKKVARIADRVERNGVSLNGRTMPEVAMALDIVHNGRGGRTTYSKIARALDEADPMQALRQIGRSPTFEGRIDRVADRASDLLGAEPYVALRYRAADNSFV